MLKAFYRSIVFNSFVSLSLIRAVSAMDATYHTELKSWINAQDVATVEKGRNLENSVEKMFEKVEKIHRRHQNYNSLRSSAAQFLQHVNQISKWFAFTFFNFGQTVNQISERLIL